MQVNYSNLLEMFRGNLALVTKDSVNVNDAGGQNGEKETKSKDDGVSDTDAQGRFAAKERVLELILEERGDGFGTKAHCIRFGWNNYKSSNGGNKKRLVVGKRVLVSTKQNQNYELNDPTRRETRERKKNTFSAQLSTRLVSFMQDNQAPQIPKKISEGLIGVGPSSAA